MSWEKELGKDFNFIALNQQNLILTVKIIKSYLTIKSFGLLMIQMHIEWQCIKHKKVTWQQNQSMELFGFSIQKVANSFLK